MKYRTIETNIFSGSNFSVTNFTLFDMKVDFDTFGTHKV